MNKFCTILSIALSVACFAYMFNGDVICSCLIGGVAFLFTILGFYIESKARYYWNVKFNKILYWLSANDKEYNIECKEFTYTCGKDKEYSSRKDITICPMCNDLDRITERFAWSAPSGKAEITPIVEGQRVSSLRQQELWTYYTVSFEHFCEKRKSFKTGSIISNLIDVNNEAVPFLSATVDRKTKHLVLKVCFKEIEAPKKASFKVFTNAKADKEIYKEELYYDDVIGGFVKKVDYPRRNWKYVISWE